MAVPNAGPADAPGTDRSSATAPLVGWPLRTRLAVFLALAIALVIGVTTYLQSRVFERTVESEISETARLTAMAVADDLELREGPFTAEELPRRSRSSSTRRPNSVAISVVTLEAGAPAVFASTSAPASASAVDAGRRAIERRALVWSSRDAPVRVLAVPFSRSRKLFGAVAVSVSFDRALPAADKRPRDCGVGDGVLRGGAVRCRRVAHPLAHPPPD